MKPQSLLAFVPGLMMVAAFPWLAAAGALPSHATPAPAPQAIEGFINVPVQEAWRLFTTPAGYQLAGMGNAEVELRIGGSIRTVYGSQAVPQTVFSEILAYEPQRMLATRIRQPAADFAYREASAGPWSVMYFTPSGPDMTQVRIVGLGYNDTAQSQALRKFLTEGNRTLLDQIAKHYWPKCKLCEKQASESK